MVSQMTTLAHSPLSLYQGLPIFFTMGYLSPRSMFFSPKLLKICPNLLISLDLKNLLCWVKYHLLCEEPFTKPFTKPLTFYQTFYQTFYETFKLLPNLLPNLFMSRLIISMLLSSPPHFSLHSLITFSTRSPTSGDSIFSSPPPDN